MGIVIDIVLLAIAALIIFFCWKRGFIKSVIGFVCDAVAIVAAYALTPEFSGFLCERFFLGKVSGALDATVRSAAESEAGVDVGRFVTEIPGSLEGTLEKYNVSDEALKEFVSRDLSSTGEDAVRSVSEFIARPTSRLLSNAVAFILIFVASLIVLRLVSKLILIICKAPVIEKADKTAGVILGILNALLVLFVLSLAAAVAVRALGTYMPKQFEGAVDHSIILKFFSKFNPISVIRNVLESN